MRTMLVVAAAAALPLLFWLYLSLVAATARVWRGGLADAGQLDRAGLDLGRFLLADLRPDGSPLVPTRVGIGARYKDGRLQVRKMRGISREAF